MPRTRRGSNRVRWLPFREGIAGIRGAAIESGAEPAGAVRRRPVREGLGRHAAAGHLLELVVAHRGGGPQAFLDVAGIEHLPLRRGMSPHAGVAIRLQLEADRERVALRGILLRESLHALAEAEHVLHVVPDLVRDDVGLGEVARSAETAGPLPVETPGGVNA